jgi:type I restriction enzyme S subunit
VCDKPPNHWATVSLSDICIKASKVKRKELEPDSNFLYLDISSIDNVSNKITGHNQHNWREAPLRAQQIIQTEDILFSTVRVYLKNIAKVTNPIYSNQICSSGFTVLRANEDLCHPNYLFAYTLFEGFLNPLCELQTGTSYPAVRDNDVFAQIIPLPPLPEQRAIVNKIEQLFSELDNGIANLKQAQEQLKVYRQALLAKTSVTEKFVPILQVVEDLSQGWSPKCHNHSRVNSNEWAVIKTTSIQEGYFDEKENKKLPDDLSPRIKHELKIGDILITRAGPRVRVGVCCLIKKVKPRLLNCDKAYRIRLKKDCIIPEFFEFTMNSPRYKFIIEELKTGISDSGVNLTQKGFLAIDIPVPPIQEQQAIVTEIETRLSVCDKLEQDISDSLEKAEALRQSILKQAFEGKLLNEQELTAVRSDPEWEPAEALLAKIKSKTT